MRVTAHMLEEIAKEWGSHATAHPVHGPSTADFVMDIDGVTFLIETKSSGALGAVASSLQQLQGRGADDAPIAIVVPYMSESAGALCRREGVSWFDLSGNADIAAGDLRIKIRGFSNRFRRPGRPANAFTAHGSRITRAMLIDPSRRWGVRELASELDMLPGSVSKVLTALRNDGYVTRDELGDRPLDPDLLLEAWTERYSFEQHSVQKLHTAVEGGVTLTRTLAKRLRSAGVEHAFTGSAGAYFVEPAAAFRIVVVYVMGDARPALSDLGIRSVESGENIWLVTPADDGVLYGSEAREAGKITTVCLPQLYADLGQLPERSAEVAAVLKRRGLWNEAS